MLVLHHDSLVQNPQSGWYNGPPVTHVTSCRLFNFTCAVSPALLGPATNTLGSELSVRQPSTSPVLNSPSLCLEGSPCKYPHNHILPLFMSPFKFLR